MTLQTELLESGSPAIGMGILAGAPLTDERGFASIVDGAINVGATSSVPAPSSSVSPLAATSQGNLAAPPVMEALDWLFGWYERVSSSTGGFMLS
jgi:hypothetical protein